MQDSQSYFDSAWNGEQAEHQHGDEWENPFIRSQPNPSINGFHAVGYEFVQPNATGLSNEIHIGTSSTLSKSICPLDSPLPKLPIGQIDFQGSLESEDSLGTFCWDSTQADSTLREGLAMEMRLPSDDWEELGGTNHRKSQKKRPRLNGKDATPQRNQRLNSVNHSKSHGSAAPSLDGLSLDASSACNHWCSCYPGTLAGYNEIYGLHLAYHAPVYLLTRWFKLHGRIKDKAAFSLGKVGPGSDVTRKYRHHQKRCNPKDVGGTVVRDEGEPYACTSRCGAKFKKKDCWRRHEELNFPQELWVCGINDCGAESWRKDHFRNHIRKCHKHTAVSKQKLEECHFDIDSLFDKYCIFRRCNEYFPDWRDRIDHIAKELEGPWDIADWRDIDNETNEVKTGHQTDSDTDSESDNDNADASDGDSDNSDSDHDNNHGAGLEPDSGSGRGSGTGSGTGSGQSYGQFGPSGAHSSDRGHGDHEAYSSFPNWTTSQLQKQKSSLVGSNNAIISAESTSTMTLPFRTRNVFKEVESNTTHDVQEIELTEVAQTESSVAETKGFVPDTKMLNLDLNDCTPMESAQSLSDASSELGDFGTESAPTISTSRTRYLQRDLAPSPLTLVPLAFPPLLFYDHLGALLNPKSTFGRNNGQVERNLSRMPC
ncbi:hypothetical protein MMC18_000110 [Xylographa bjoerkii]|nr:hypothetical protein [Xylographa bjoerkii]